MHSGYISLYTTCCTCAWFDCSHVLYDLTGQDANQHFPLHLSTRDNNSSIPVPIPTLLNAPHLKELHKHRSLAIILKYPQLYLLTYHDSKAHMNIYFNLIFTSSRKGTSYKGGMRMLDMATDGTWHYCVQSLTTLNRGGDDLQLALYHRLSLLLYLLIPFSTSENICVSISSSTDERSSMNQ